MYPNSNSLPNPVTPSAEPPEIRSSLFERVVSHWFVSWILIPAALIFFLHNFIFSAYHVVGSSMTQTLQDSDYLIISKVDRTLSLITGKKYTAKRGQIIVFHYPKQPELDFVKRVAGVPGDRVVIRDGQVRVYNAEQPDGFNPDAKLEISGTYTQGRNDGVNEDIPIDVVVPEGNVFVLGDNRTPYGSSDSREWEFLPSQDIVGNVVLRLYPLNQFKVFGE